VACHLLLGGLLDLGECQLLRHDLSSRVGQPAPSLLGALLFACRLGPAAKPNVGGFRHGPVVVVYRCARPSGSLAGASPLFAKPEMGSVRFRVHKIRRRPWPSAARVCPASVPARTPRGTRTPTMTGRRVAWPGLASPPALTRRTPTKRPTLTPSWGASHSARRLRSLAFLGSSYVDQAHAQ